METNEQGDVISYEEYHPYGTSAYRSSNTAAGISLKRYRFSGKERDDETGFYYFGARYYAPWLGRWTSSDPAGLTAGQNMYRYCSNNPLMYVDPNGMQDGPVREVTGSAALSDRNREADARAELERTYHVHITAMHFGALPSGKSGWIADAFEDLSPGGGNGGNGGNSGNSGNGGNGGSQQATPPAANTNAAGSNGGGGNEPPSTEGGAVTAAGGNVIRNNPVGETLTVPQTVTDAKLARLNEGAAQGELARNTGPGNSTTARRTAPVQRQALRDFEAGSPRPAPNMQAGHRIDLQYDRTGRMGNNARDYIWEDGATNVNDGREGYRIMNNEHPVDGTVFGRAARPDTAGRFYNTPRFRSGARIAGGLLTAAGVGLSGYSLYHDIREHDVPMGIGDSLGVVGGGLELYALGSATYSGAAVGSVTVGGLAALPLGIAVGGVGLAVVSGVGGYRAYQRGDTGGAIAGGVGVVAGTALAVGGGIAVAAAAGVAMAPVLIAAAPVLIAVGAVLALGVGVYHIGRHFHWWGNDQ
jgi:RHS repeat-associated protein